jgi:hypothetical protein
MSEPNSSLAHARIVEVNENDALSPKDKPGIPCMFNPYEYTLSKSNTFNEQDSAKGENSPVAEVSKAGAQTLQLSLIFDTYIPSPYAKAYAPDGDVSQVTDRLWGLMRVTKAAQSGNQSQGKQDKPKAPLVAFHWGVFFFVSYITNMTQKFTLFSPKGIPVRAKVDITFTQYTDINDRRTELRQNPTSGGGPVNRVHRVVAGDRLDLIAQAVYRNPTEWRRIAQFNGIVDPLGIRPGQVLVIPFLEEHT